MAAIKTHWPIALLLAAIVAALVWSCAGRIDGAHFWTPWGHASVTNAQWGARTTDLATNPPTNKPLPPLNK